jgi:hypothetical protein
MNIPQTTSPTPQTSTAAIVSLVAGIVCWVMLPVVAAIAAIVAGHMARAEIRRSPQLDGDGMAIAGLTLGYVQLILVLLSFMALLLFFLFFGSIAVLAVLFGR